MTAGQIIVGSILFSSVATPFLFAFYLGREFSKKVVIRIALTELFCLLGFTLFLYYYGRNSSYGPEETAILFLFVIALPVFIFSVFAFAFGQWFRNK